MEKRADGKPRNHPYPDAIEVHELRKRAYNLKRSGLSYDDVADEMRIAKSTAWQYVQDYMKDDCEGDVGAERAMMIRMYTHRLSQISTALDAKPDAEQFLKLLAAWDKYATSLRKLQGFDAAEKYDVKLSGKVEATVDPGLADLFAAFEEDQDIRNEARARRRSAMKGGDDGFGEARARSTGR